MTKRVTLEDSLEQSGLSMEQFHRFDRLLGSPHGRHAYQQDFVDHEIFGYERMGWKPSYFLDPYKVRDHLCDRDYVLGADSPWDPQYVCFDIDCKTYAEIDRRDSVYSKILSAMGEPSMVFCTDATAASGHQAQPLGLQVYYFLGPKEPARSLNARVTFELERAGLRVQPGLLEVFPRARTNCRLPLGYRSFVLNPADLSILAKTKPDALSLPVFVDGPARISLDELLDRIRRYGKDKEPIRREARVPAPGKTSPLWEQAISEAGTRHSIQFQLICDCWNQGLAEVDAITKISWWYQEHDHASRSWRSDPAGVLRELEQCVRSYYRSNQERNIPLGWHPAAERLQTGKKRVHRINDLTDDDKLPLSVCEEILRVVHQPGIRDDAVLQEFTFDILRYMAKHPAGNGGHVQAMIPVDVLEKFSGGRRYKEQLQTLVELGLLIVVGGASGYASRSKKYRWVGSLPEGFPWEADRGAGVSSLEAGIKRLYQDGLMTKPELKERYSRRAYRYMKEAA